jgi:hypothetical protein
MTGFVHLRRQQHRVAALEVHVGSLTPSTLHLRLAFQHHPDDRLVVRHRLFHPFHEADLFELEVSLCHQARDRREEPGDVRCAAASGFACR